MKNQKYLTKEILTRDIQNSFYKYLDILPNPDKILSRTGKTIETYRELKNDAHLWSCIQSRKSGVLSLENRINQGKSSQYITNEIESIFDSLDLYQIIRDILEAPLFGYQPLEIIWEVAGRNNKMIVPKQIVAKPQEWFYYDGKGELKFRKAGKFKGEEIPPMKIINVQFESSYMNPYGNSLLAKCYWPLKFKNGGLRFWINFTEKYGMPMLVGQYSRGASQDEVQKLADSLNDMTQDAIIVTPMDVKVEMKEAVKSTSVELYRELIKHCNAEISKAILSQTLTTELDKGSYAAAQTHYRIRREVILSDIRLVESTLNKIIKYIVDLNFNATEYPKFSIIFNDSENEQRIERDLKISQSQNIQLTKKYLMNTYGFKEDDIEVRE